MKKLLFVLVLALVSCSKPGNAEQRADLFDSHARWVEQNIPLADTLSDRQLIREAMFAITSVSHEERELDLIRETGRRLENSAFSRYADAKANNETDIGNLQYLELMDALIDYSVREYSELSFEAVLGRYQACDRSYDHAHKLEKIVSFCQSAYDLYKAHPSYSNQLLYLLAKTTAYLVDITWVDGKAKAQSQLGEFFFYPDNYDKMYLTAAELLRFSNEHLSELNRHERLLLAEAMQKAGVMVSSQIHIPSYYTRALDYRWVEDKQWVGTGTDNIEPLSDRTSEDTIYVSGADTIILFYDYLTVQAHRLQRKVLGETHPDYVISLLTDMSRSHLPNFGPLADSLTIRFISDRYEYLTAYLGQAYPDMLAVRQSIRQLIGADNLSQISLMEEFAALKDVDKVFDDISRAKQICTTKGQVYFVSYMLPELYFVNSEEQLYDLKLRIENTLSSFGPLSPFSMLVDANVGAFFQNLGMPGYENAVQKKSWVFDFMSGSARDKIAVGFDIIVALNSFADVKQMVTVTRSTLNLIRQLYGTDNMLYRSLLLDYAEACLGHDPSWSMAINDIYDDDSVYLYVADQLRGTTIEHCGYKVALQHFHRKGDTKRYLQLAEQELKNIEKRQAGREKDYLKLEQLKALTDYVNALSGISYDELREIQRKKKIKLTDLFHKLEQEYEQYYMYATFDVVYLLVNYYTNTKEWDKAEHVLTNIIDTYYDYQFNILDGEYIRYAILLINLYTTTGTNIDKCWLFIENLKSDFAKIEKYAFSSDYILLLKIIAEMSLSYANSDLLTLDNVLNYYRKVRLYYQTSGNSIGVYFNEVLDSYSKMCQVSFNADNKSRNRQLFDEIDTQIRDSIYPDLQMMEYQYRQLYPDNYLGQEWYANIIISLARAADVLGEPSVAEDYLSKLTDMKFFTADILWMSHYFKIGEMEKALPYLKTFVGDSGIENWAYTNIVKRVSLGMRAVDAALEGKYEEALKYAQEYYETTQEYISTHFDYFTTAEVESFLAQGGVGGTVLQQLVPFVKRNDLLETAYNINLQEKGLMLRRNDRMRRAVEASGNPDLIAALDTMQRLQHELMLSNNLSAVDRNTIDKYQRVTDLERYIARETQSLVERQRSVARWQDVRAALGDGEAAVEYVVRQDIAYALVLTKKSKLPEYVELLSKEQMYSLRALLIDTTLSYHEKTDRLYGRESDLYALLWQPIEKHLNKAHRVFFSPSDVLNLISFQAIRVSDKQYLIDRYELRQLTSTAALTEPQAVVKTDAITANIYGGIYYNRLQHLTDQQLAFLRSRQPSMQAPIETTSQAPLLAKEESGVVEKDQQIAMRVGIDAFPYLRHTLYEADGIDRLLRSLHCLSTEKIGAEPTEQELRSLSGKSPKVLHISTHGFFLNDLQEISRIPYFRRTSSLNPMTTSGLVLADAEEAWLGRSAQTDTDTDSDNILTSAEVSELDLSNTRLVVLSACETGVGSVSAEGVFGLQRGFKQAGVSTICASLWTVADAATANLMQMFYSEWIGGTDMTTAMRDAMLRQRQLTPDPYYWAPFILLDATR